MKDRIRLLDDGRRITEENGGPFLLALQQALLLGLKEEGILDSAQCRWAEEQLKKQGGNPPAGGISG